MWYNILNIIQTSGTGALAVWEFTLDRPLPWRGETGVLPGYIMVNSNNTTTYNGNSAGNPDIKYPKIQFAIDKLNGQFFDSGDYQINLGGSGILRTSGDSLDTSLGVQKAIIYCDDGVSFEGIAMAGVSWSKGAQDIHSFYNLSED